MKSVEDAYRPAFEEIKRRSEAAKVPEAESVRATVDRTAADNLPYQNMVLITVGTAVLPPVPIDPKHPSLRIYGAFDERDEAVDHSQVVREVDPKCSQLVVPCNEWWLMPQHRDVLESVERKEAVLRRRLEEETRRRCEDEDRFETMVRERTAAPDVVERLKDRSEDQQEEEDAVREVYKPPRRMRAGAEVRGQTAAALSVLRDPDGGECLLRFYGCFETSALADEWAKKQSFAQDILVAPLCEWIYPNGTQRLASGTAQYEHGELQRIMDAAEENPKRVQRYKEWKRSQDEEDARRELLPPEDADPPASSEGGSVS